MHNSTNDFMKSRKRNGTAYANNYLTVCEKIYSSCRGIGYRQFRKVLFLVVSLSMLTIICVYVHLIHENTQTVSTDRLHTINASTWVPDLKCYNLPQEDDEVPVIPGYDVQPNSIFFVETSCRHAGKLNLTKRQACTYESAARAHPSSEVVVLFPSPVSLRDPPLLVSKLLQYPNIKLVHIDVERYVAGTPLKDFDIRKRLAESNWPVVHSSDILRLLTLWKYGGTYLDSDFVVFRSFNKMENYAGAGYRSKISNAVINVNINGTGGQIIEDMLLELRDTFRGNNWGYNGPSLLPRVLRRTCNESDVLKMTPEKCHGFSVFPPPPRSPFLPTLPYSKLVEEKASQAFMDTLLESMIGIHMINSKNGGIPVKTGSGVVYDVLASRFCPEVYSVVGDHF